MRLIQILSLCCTQTVVANMMHNHFMFVKVYEVYTPSLGIDEKNFWFCFNKRQLLR